MASSSHVEASETTPLLAVENTIPASSSASTSTLIPTSTSHSNGKPAGTTTTASSAIPNTDKPLPVTQILLLCFIRLAEPISFFSIFPFISQMVATNGSLPPSSVGYYSGLIESLFSLTQMFVMILWGRASDRVGRKPILVISLAGISVTTAAFGLSRTIWQMIVLRCLSGIFAGTVVTVRTMVGEHSTVRTQARSYSWYGIAGNIGILVGPLMGGALAEPARQYGGWWASVWFFREYPYALATFATGLFTLVCTVVAALFIEETLPSKTKTKTVHVANGDNMDAAANEASGDDNEAANKPERYSIAQLLRVPGVPIVLALYTHVMMLANGYTAMSPVYWYTPRDEGGFGFSELQISIMLAVTGAAQAVWLLGVFPPLTKKIGTRGVMWACGIAYPFFACVNPLMGLLRWNESQEADVAFWIIGPTLLAIGVGVSMSFTAIQLSINLVSPSQESLGTLNSVALALSSGTRAFVPFLWSSVLAIGIKHQILGGQLVWLLFVVLAALFAVGTFWLPDKTDDREKAEETAESS